MIIVMKNDVTEKQIGAVVYKIQYLGHKIYISRDAKHIAISAIGDESKLDPEMCDPLPGVENSMHIVKQCAKQCKIVSRESHKQMESVTVSETY